MLTLQTTLSNHNGGKITFGNDNYLYIGLEYRRSGSDPQGSGQNRSTLLGSILRINVDSAGGGREYSIPVTNPFYNNAVGYKEEIYAYGIRNPWKFSFDSLTNRLFLGDVGQNLYEEIDVVENGKNYGWNKMEGFHCYVPAIQQAKDLLDRSLNTLIQKERQLPEAMFTEAHCCLVFTENMCMLITVTVKSGV
ncbi:MAG: PQQ-dependent sugar dehydrogenase [Ignavibacteria bacterium]